MEQYRTNGSREADECACDTLMGKMGSCLKRLRAPAMRLSYRMEKTFIPDLDREKAACGCTDAAGSPSAGAEDSGCGCTDDVCPIPGAEETDGSQESGTPGCGCTDADPCSCGDACTCGKPCTMVEAGHLTVRIFDLCICAAVMAVMCCCMKMKK